jgi:hypothetical protein
MIFDIGKYRFIRRRVLGAQYRISTAVGDKVEVRGGGRGWSFETTEVVGFAWSQPHISSPLHPRHTRG